MHYQITFILKLKNELQGGGITGVLKISLLSFNYRGIIVEKFSELLRRNIIPMTENQDSSYK